MKRTIMNGLVLGLFALGAWGAPGQQHTPTLGWENDPDNDTNTVTVLYWRPTLPSGGDTNWNVLTVKAPGETTHTLTNFTPTKAYFVATASNLWGESLFSNILGVGGPGTNRNLRLVP